MTYKTYSVMKWLNFNATNATIKLKQHVGAKTKTNLNVTKFAKN